VRILIASERQQKIYEMMEDKGSVHVTNLSKYFNVTKETIRRDLEQLEKQGFISRTHGGAILNREEKEIIPNLNKQVFNINAKKSIATEAAKMVTDGDIIALDSSDISFQLAKQLTDHDITIITNSIAVTLEFLNKEKIKVITVGGYLNKDLSSFIGTIAEKSIEGYHVDKYFFSCNGFHLEFGIYENNEMEAQVKQKFMTISDKLVLLADHSKFGQKSLTQMIGFDKVDILITDQELSIHNLSALKGKGIHVQLAE
jgi:DeoR/GlpR family transcriptional regulator of sugar metabolism